MRLLLAVMAAWLLAVMAAQARPSKGDVLTGKVVRVTDGDGPVLEDGTKIRLYGIDTQETGQEPKEYGALAKQALETMTLGRVITCKVRDIDRYGRPVGHCAIDETDIGAELVRAGLAWNNWQYGRDFYADEEEEAVCARRGIWSSGITPPWHWRACARKAADR